MAVAPMPRSFRLPSNWLPTRRRRLMLAGFIDFSVFGAIWGVFEFALRSTTPLRSLPWILSPIVFLPIELIVFSRWRYSLGLRWLGIYSMPAEAVPHAPQTNSGWVFVNDPEIAMRESWLTMLIGALLVNGGAKSLVRWTMWQPPEPWFGLGLPAPVSVALTMAMGAALIYAGACFLQVRARGLAIALSTYGVWVLSVFTSWSQWDPLIAEYVHRRRAFFGLPVRPGEIEFQQRLTPEFLVAFVALWMVFMLFALPRLRAQTLVFSGEDQRRAPSRIAPPDSRPIE